MESPIEDMDDIVILDELEEGEIDDTDDNVCSALPRPKDSSHSTTPVHKPKKTRTKNTKRDVSTVSSLSSSSRTNNNRVETNRQLTDCRTTTPISCNNSRTDNCRKRREGAPAPPRPSFDAKQQQQHSRLISPGPYRRKVEPIRVSGENARFKFEDDIRNDSRNGRRDDRPRPPISTFLGRSRTKLLSPNRSSPRSSPRRQQQQQQQQKQQQQQQQHRPNLNDYTSKRHRFLSTIRRKSQAPVKPARRTAQETSYDELLKLHQEIQSKLKDLSKEESNNQVSDISSDDLEDLNKENVKTTRNENSHQKDDDKQESHFGLWHINQLHGSRQPSHSGPTRSASRSSRNSTDAKSQTDVSQCLSSKVHGSRQTGEKMESPSRLPEQKRSRPSSRSSRHSSDSKPNVDTSAVSKEDEEEIMLRELALLSTLKARPKKVPIVVELDSIELPPDQPQTSCSDEAKLSQDNYDDVEMELDSRSSSPCILDESVLISCSDSAEPPAPVNEDDQEEDEDLLRAMLLSSLKLPQPSKVPDEAPDESLPTTADKPASASRKTNPSLKMVASAPVHRPVVINLNEDSDSETETDSPKKPSILSIDDLLNSARQLSEFPNHVKPTANKSLVVPPVAVHQLPESEADEYNRLKAEIAKRENLRRIPKSASSSRPESGAELTPGNNSPVHVPIAVIKDDGKLRRSEEKWWKNRRAIWGCSKELKKLSLQIGSRSSALRNAELKITKLKEQLTAAARIADAQRRQLERMMQVYDEMGKDMDSKNSLQRSLEMECRKYGAEIHGSSYELPTNSVNNVPVKRKFSSAVVSPNNRKRFVSNKVFKSQSLISNTGRKQYEVTPQTAYVDAAQEKIRLQGLEKMVAARLASLRQQTSNVSKSSSKTAVTAVAKPSPGARQVTLLYDDVATEIGLASSTATTSSSSSFLPKNLPTGLILTCHNDLAKSGASPEDADAAQSQDFSESQIARLKELQNELSQTKLVNNFAVKTYTFDLHNMFADEVPKLKVKLPKLRVANAPGNTTQFGIGPYRSPLLHLKSYRFSPYFRTKANQCISWPTHSHKAKTMVRLCQFDLLGKCNDDNCPRQHLKDYAMSPKEVLCDIVSYCPSLTGITNKASVAECKMKIEKYVDKLQTSNQDRMTLDELCVLLIGRVNEHLNSVPPHYAKYETRLWHPNQEDSASVEIESSTPKKRRKSFKKQIISVVDSDEIVEETDVRYFQLDGQVDHIESALKESPNDAILWLRLAHRKLNTPGCSPDLCLDLALDVLSRGLELNPNCTKLWLLYLNLYDKHENNGDILQLCDQAVKFCSDYDVWWKYLQCARGFVMKETVCLDGFSYLLSSSEPAEILSHHLLELLFYRVQLNLMCGRQQSALSIFKKAMGSDPTDEGIHQIVILDHLVSDDSCLAWLCYIYLFIFGRLPQSLFGFTDDGLGKLVNKAPFVLPWNECDRRFQLSGNPILALFGNALTKCLPANGSESVNVHRCIAVVYQNLVDVALSRGRNNAAVSFCERQLDKALTDDVWVILASVHFISGDLDKVRQTLARALKSVNSSPRLYNFAAMFEMSQKNVDAARNWVSCCATSLFDFPVDDDEDVAVLDTVTLYSKMLGLPMFSTAKFPPAKSLQLIISQKQFIWLNYCIYLTALGKEDEAKESFEMALVRVTDKKDLELIWMHYLQYNLSRLSVSATQQKDFDSFGTLVHRCLSAVSCTVSLPGSPGKVWHDYTFFNSVVDLYSSILDADQQIVVYERFHELSPQNNLLAEKLLRLYLERGECQKAWLLCRTQIESTSPSIYLWNTALQIARKEKSVSETRKLFGQAVEALPFVASLWTEYIIFECLENQAENARRLMIECKTFGIVIDDFFDELLFS